MFRKSSLRIFAHFSAQPLLAFLPLLLATTATADNGGGDDDDNIIAQPDWDRVREAADLSNRVFLFRGTDSFDASFETYHESDDGADAAAVAVRGDHCLVAIRGTRPVAGTEVSGVLPPRAEGGLRDVAQNFGVFVKKKIASATDPGKTCTVGNSYFNAYFNLPPEMEDQIGADCVAGGKELVFTGHSQGAALAQFGAGT
jgi:hypothetical protein